MSLKVYKRKDLLSLPQRPWNQTSIYDSVLLVPTGKKHDSGFSLIAVVGIRDYEPIEIAAFCDDVNWYIDAMIVCGTYTMPNLRTDMLYPSGIAHVWCRKKSFVVKESLSSTDIHVIQKVKS
jgi:hypothetical protein